MTDREEAARRRGADPNGLGHRRIVPVRPPARAWTAQNGRARYDRPRHDTQVKANDLSEAKDRLEAENARVARDRGEATHRILAAYELMMARLMTAHRPEFLEIGITMPQAKVLYILEAAGEVHMSGLVAMLGVSLSTVSGLVDRLVDQGLATRHEDRVDRRQVVVAPTSAAEALIERFRELNTHQFVALLDVLSDYELGIVSRAIEILARAAEGGRTPANPGRRERSSS